VKVICISGKAQHGKDTSASIIKEKLKANGYKVLITHYSDILKHVCRSFFNWDGNKDEKGRWLLQYVGTDMVRAKRPDFWVDFMVDVLNLFYGSWDYVLIPDCRFPNELQRIKSAGFDMFHLRIIREPFQSPLTPEQQKHPSETALDDVAADRYIHNSGSIEALDEALAGWIVEFNGSHQLSLNEVREAGYSE
jgi:hypothetical protein